MADAAAPRHYNRAPIVEATLGMTVHASHEDVSAALEGVRQALEGDYPTPLTPEGESADGTDGVYVLQSADGKYVVRFGKDRFALSRLEPYDRWESFSDEFRRTWSVFEDAVRPVRLDNFWVRYINKLRVPLNRPLREFFTVYPAWPDPNVLFSQLFLLAETNVAEPPGKLLVYLIPVIPEATLEPEGGGFIPMLLSNTFTFQADAVDAVWRNMDAVRKVKNSIFNSQLTDEMKETIT